MNYPNSVLATSVITNFTDQKDEPIRARVRFQIGYLEDVENVMELAKKIINETEGPIEGTAEVVVRSLWDEEGGGARLGSPHGGAIQNRECERTNSDPLASSYEFVERLSRKQNSVRQGHFRNGRR